MFHLHPKLEKGWIKNRAGICAVNRKRGLAHIMIPKNASTTMRTVLSPCAFLLDSTPKGHEIISRCSVMAIVREPLSRFVSSYHEVDERLHKPGYDLPLMRAQKFASTRGTKERFRQFVRDVHKGIFDNHLVQQSRHISEMRCRIDEWLSFEDIKAQMSAYMRSHGIRKSVPHRKKSKHRQRNAMLLALLRSERRLRDAVREIYREDFKLYKEITNARVG